MSRKLHSLAVVLLLILTCFHAAAEVRTFDVVVIGGTPGGIGAAVSAARYGHSVALVEYHKHLGGMSTSGLGKSDVETIDAIGGLFREFTGRVLAHYSETFGATSEQVELCRNGYYYEPSVAERIFNTMIAEQGSITVMLHHRLEEVSRKGNRVTGARIMNRDTGEEVDLRGKVFIDATYEGDLAAFAGADYRVGRESRDEFDEAHAGVIYMDHGTRALLPGTTGLGDDRLTSYTYRLCLSTDPENQIMPSQPADYDRNRYLGYFQDLKLGRLKSALLAFSIAPIPNHKTDTNMKPWPLGFPFAEENVGYPEADWEEREKISRKIRSITEGLFWFLQNDPEVPESDRMEARKYGYARDEFTDNDGFPFQLYVREARRLKGLYTLTENDLTFAPEKMRAPVHEDAIASGEFPIDSFPTRKWEPGRDDALEGYILMLKRYTRPYQIPYRTMVPEKVDGLLVPVALSATHIAFSTVRMEPTWMCLGQAAGTAAHLCIERKVEPRKVSTVDLQQLLVQDGQVITYFSDLADCGSALPGVQYWGARGFFDDYVARPKEPVSRELANRWWRIAFGSEFDPTTGNEDSGIRHEEFLARLQEEAGKPHLVTLEGDSGAVTRGAFCQALYEVVQSKSE